MAACVELVDFEDQLDHPEEGYHGQSYAQDNPDGLLLLLHPRILHSLPLFLVHLQSEIKFLIGARVIHFASVVSLPPQELLLQLRLFLLIRIAIAVTG